MIRTKVRNHCKYCKIVSQYYAGSNAEMIQFMINENWLPCFLSCFKTLGQDTNIKVMERLKNYKKSLPWRKLAVKSRTCSKKEWYREFDSLQLQMWWSLWNRNGQYVSCLCSSKCTYPV